MTNADIAQLLGYLQNLKITVVMSSDTYVRATVGTTVTLSIANPMTGQTMQLATGAGAVQISFDNSSRKGTAMNHEVVAKAYAFAAATGIPWPTIWTWIETVLWSKSSLSIIEQVIAIILSIVGQGGTVDWTKLAAYGSAVVQALIAGQPVPPYTP